MSTYDDSTRLAALAVMDANLTAATAIGMAYAESVIRLAYATMSAPNAASGDPGTLSIIYNAGFLLTEGGAYVTQDGAVGGPGGGGYILLDNGAAAISPPPTVDLRDQFRNRGGMTLHVGDAGLCITRAVSRVQLLEASWVEIDGEKYTIVAGELRRRTFYWDVVVKRMQA
jgi:hypothetical protein